jgi:hypothetical protein
MSHLRGHEASSRQTLNVESYIRIDIQYHGLVHESNKIRKRKKDSGVALVQLEDGLVPEAATSEDKYPFLMASVMTELTARRMRW